MNTTFPIACALRVPLRPLSDGKMGASAARAARIVIVRAAVRAVMGNAVKAVNK